MGSMGRGARRAGGRRSPPRLAPPDARADKSLHLLHAVMRLDGRRRVVHVDAARPRGAKRPCAASREWPTLGEPRATARAVAESEPLSTMVEGGLQKTQICDVWAENLEREFVTIRETIVNYPFIAMVRRDAIRPCAAHECHSERAQHVNVACTHAGHRIPGRRRTPDRQLQVRLGLPLPNGARPPPTHTRTRARRFSLPSAHARRMTSRRSAQAHPLGFSAGPLQC